jgi:Spy/CpxP family protein refolding chaperone
MNCFARKLTVSVAALGISAFAPSLASGAEPGVAGAAPMGPAAAAPQAGAGAAQQAPQAGAQEEVSEGAGGMIGMAADALGQVNLRADQRPVVEALLQEASIRHEPLVAAHDELMRALAAEIEQEGPIDRAAIDEQADKLADAWTCVTTADLAALETLHGLLDQQQRTQLAAAFQEKVDALVESHEPGNWVDKAAEDLGLSDEQKTELTLAACELMAGKASGKDTGERLSKTLEAFQGEEFDAQQFAPNEEEVEARVDSMLDFVGQIEEMLTPEQQQRAAQLITERIGQPEEEAEGPQQPPAGQAPQGAAPAGTARGETVGSTQEPLIATYGPGYGRGYGYGYGGYAPYGGYAYGSRSASRYASRYAYSAGRSYRSYYSSSTPFGYGWGWGGVGW